MYHYFNNIKIVNSILKDKFHVSALPWLVLFFLLCCYHHARKLNGIIKIAIIGKYYLLAKVSCSLIFSTVIFQFLLKDRKGKTLVEEYDKYENTPLHVAAKKGYVRIVQVRFFPL